MFTHEPTRQDEQLVTGYIGHEVLDEHGLHLGHVTDVVHDREDGHPEYLVVDPGLLRPSHYVPVAGSYHTSTGQIVVPWDKHWVKTATKAAAGDDLSPEARAELAHHYTAA
jgi:sporulation protein YlmC with PRC-barrel domain